MTAEDATAEIGWVAREALAIIRVGVPEDSERRRDFMARKRAVLAHIDEEWTP